MVRSSGIRPRQRCSKPKPAGCAQHSTGMPPSGCRRLLNLGSSTAKFRAEMQPWTERGLFRPLRARGVAIVHVDRRDRAGRRCPRRSDRSRRPAATACAGAAGGLVLQSVGARDRARSARPSLSRNPAAIRPRLCHGAVQLPLSPRPDRHDVPAEPGPIGGAVRRCALCSTARSSGPASRIATMSGGGPGFYCATSPAFRRPSCHGSKWKRSMAKLYWLAAEYRITCAVFEKQ